MPGFESRLKDSGMVVFVFAACGLLAGIGAFIVFINPNSYDWFIDGAVFLAALAMALGVCRAMRFLPGCGSPIRYVAASLMIVVLPYLSLLGGVLGAGLCVGLPLSLYVGKSLDARASTIVMAAFGIMLGTLCGATWLGLAVRVVMGRGNGVAFRWFALCGVLAGLPFTIAILNSSPWAANDYRLVSILHLIAAPLYAATAGYALTRQGLAFAQ